MIAALRDTLDDDPLGDSYNRLAWLLSTCPMPALWNAAEAVALAKQAVNQAEDRMGLRDTMDAAFALHHLAHAHNAMTSPDHLAGEDAKSMAAKAKKAD